MQTHRANHDQRARWNIGGNLSLSGACKPALARHVAVGSPPGAPVRLPEVDLVLAVFEDAVRCIQNASPTVTRRQHQEALRWIAAERRDWPFSFVNVCKFLGMDASAVRAMVRGDDRRIETR
jgi:hypothetical protein